MSERLVSLPTGLQKTAHQLSICPHGTISALGDRQDLMAHT